MRHATPELHNLAERLLAHEAKRLRSPIIKNNVEDISAAAMEAACLRLHKTLVPLIGATGFHALLARSLTLAKREYPFLDAITTNEKQAEECSLNGVREAAEKCGKTEIKREFAAIFANFIWLLVTFIGEDLAFMYLRETWSDVSFDGATSSMKKGNER